MQSTMEGLLESLKNVFPYINLLFDGEVSVAVTDCEKFLYTNYSKELDLRAKPGDPIPSGGGVRAALDSKREVVKEVPEHVYGIPFKSYAIPVREGNTIVGVVVFGKSLAKKTAVTSVTGEMVRALTEISTVINQIAQGVQEIASMNQSLLTESNETRTQVEEIKTLLRL
jgi:hypothetical protein